MKVSELIKVCQSNVKFVLDGEGPTLWKDEFIRLYAGTLSIHNEVACISMEPDGYGDVVCEISTVYENNGQA